MEGENMKELTMHLKNIPPGYYAGMSEVIYCISPEKVYMVRQQNLGEIPMIKYLFRLPTVRKVYEGLITEELYEGILRDIPFATGDVKCQKIFEYLYGKDTVRVITEDEDIVAIGPEENKEWQYEFQKYHV
jgi:hypothetical protein